MRSHRKKNEQEIKLVSGRYLHDFLITLTYISNGEKKTKIIDFLPLFQRYVQGDNLQYFAPARFKKFLINDGNISWGKNEDVVFPVSTFLKDKRKNSADEIVYVI